MRSLIAVLLILSCSGSAWAQAKMPHARIVFLTPKGVDAPDGVSERLTQVADYTEALFVKWMKLWDYPPAREKIFERNADGSVKILFVQSPDAVNTGQFQLKDSNLSRHGKLLAIEKYELDQTLDVWWVWVYAGDPPVRFQSFLGSGNAAQGGLSQVNYANIAGKIAVDDDIASPFLEDIMLKGCIHEFGHALGLVHNGPLEQADLGMPLMGATIINYRNRMKNKERRGYLSDASAAILWKHPLFTGTSEKRYMIPKIEWHDIQVENNAKERNATLAGRVTSSNVPAHTVIVYDLAPNVWTPYFQKPYVARVEKNGTFKLTITEPVTVQTTGIFKFAACCENGSMTGDGKSRGIGSTHDIEYQTTPTGYKLGK